ncbi:S8 family serine peptidase [Streptomyces sp. CRN 30]|uniref:S8 family serine peptidase n=1 Tax=Streptomyces sp. CRN 30 TaxID=3075613 RepID=UPI002A838026|nr:S8 family serine peptidase [Streptomyces sp. CRN 30]
MASTRQVARGGTSTSAGLALLLIGVVGAAAATAATAAAPASAADGDTLPRVAVAPPDDGGCVARSARSARTAARTPWAQQYLAPSRAWELSRGAGVTVAVLDTGVAAEGTAPLAGRVTAGPDVVGGGTAGTDCVGHGTFVAGLIAGAAADGGTGFAGVAPDARILSVRVTAADGTTTADRIAEGIDAAVAGDARIVDVPFALASSSAALTRAVASAERHGVVVVAPAYASARDDGDAADASAPAAYPAALPTVLAVAGLTPEGNPEETAAPATAPDLSAPGTGLTGIGPGGGGLTGGGAELATAFVAGTAALVDAYRPGLSAAELRGRLTATAYPSAADRALTGAGTVDPAEAVSAPGTGAGTAADADAAGGAGSGAGSGGRPGAEGAAGAAGVSGAADAAGVAGAAEARGPRTADRPGGPDGAGGTDVRQGLALPGPPGHRGRLAALWIAGIAAGVVALTAAIAFAVPRGRRRRWSAGA